MSAAMYYLTLTKPTSYTVLTINCSLLIYKMGLVAFVML